MPADARLALAQDARQVFDVECAVGQQREQFAHERLGFASPVVEQWLSDLGLQMMQRRDLPPATDDKQDKLTVSLWLAERPAAETAAGAAKQSNLERIS